MSIISGPTILTADGRYFDFCAPSGPFSVNEIARGLANTCRFGGQCTRYYSVAEHSIYVSQIVPPQWAAAGLFHDAAEAFIGDMPKPLKELLLDYQEVEARVEAVLFPALGMPVKLPHVIKEADRVMLATEQQQLMENKDHWKWTDKIQPLDFKLKCLSPQQAYDAFIMRVNQLGFRMGWGGQ